MGRKTLLCNVFMTHDTSMSLKCVVITPARDEARNLERLYHSLASQTHRPVRWIVVNDGSTDESERLLDGLSSKCDWMEVINLPRRETRDFGAKANALNKGYQMAAGINFDVVGNLDADVSFGPDYLQYLMHQFEVDARLGVAGTPFTENGYDSAEDSFEGGSHVAGGCQLFRRACFDEIGGYVPNPAGGVDWIAVTSARMLGWRTRSFREKRFQHHRPLGTAERSVLASAFSYGEKDYYLGNSPVWQVFRVAYRMCKRPFFAGGIALLCGYVSAAVRRTPRPGSPELIRFHRREQMTKLRAIIGSLVRLRKFDKFTLKAGS
jgi:poly-beta-1,6-N-acetyl-D-glucosamine synthase